jgi:hypothetical protein
VQPRLASCVVVLGVNRFVVDMRKVATQAGDLLHEAALSLGHEFSIALIPQFITVSNCSRDTGAVGLDRVFCYQFGLEWWQFAMPVHDLWFVVFNGGIHLTPSVEDAAKRPRATAPMLVHEDINGLRTPRGFRRRVQVTPVD